MHGQWLIDYFRLPGALMWDFVMRRSGWEAGRTDEWATEFQRLLGRFVLLLAGVWFIVLIAGAAGIFRGVSIPILNWAIILRPGSCC